MLTFAPMFLGYYMNSYYYHKQLFPLMQGVKVLSISKGNIGGTLISLPRSHSEQKKIVDLLRLIDIRIRKQQQIIETLKKYKRGAITHILSGKSYEFAAEATWTERTLAELCCEFRSGRNISATLIHETGDYPVYGGNGIRGYCGQYSHDGEYVVVGRQGALCGNVRLVQGKNYLSEHAIAVRANEENETKFLLYLLDYMKLGQYSDQGAQPGLAVNKLLRLKCTVPDKKTQSKIASFLMRHDSQISAQERMLALLTNQRTAYKKQLSALQRSRDSLEQDIDRIAPDDKYAERRRADMTRRLNDLYDQIYKAEDLLQESMMKKATLESEQMSVQSMIGILSSFDIIYDRMNAAERRDLVKYLISEVELFPREEQKTQKRFVKAIAYKFPIEQKVLTQFDECGASVETVCLLEQT